MAQPKVTIKGTLRAIRATGCQAVWLAATREFRVTTKQRKAGGGHIVSTSFHTDATDAVETARLAALAAWPAGNAAALVAASNEARARDDASPALVDLSAHSGVDDGLGDAIEAIEQVIDSGDGKGGLEVTLRALCTILNTTAPTHPGSELAQRISDTLAAADLHVKARAYDAACKKWLES